jgi:hypothetical protein
LPPAQEKNMSEEHDNAVPEAQAEPAAEPEDAPVESLLGLRDYLAVAPRHRSDAVTKAAHSALQRWMERHGPGVSGFYTMAEWQAYYDKAMAYTG